MGTRADFYVGRGADAAWLGSIGWDGYPEGIDDAVLEAEEQDEFLAALGKFFDDRDDVTLPDQGWPWPWDTSHTTDWAYAFDDGQVWASNFGEPWCDVPTLSVEQEPVVFPDMSEKANVTFGPRSGLIVISL